MSSVSSNSKQYRFLTWLVNPGRTVIVIAVSLLLALSLSLFGITSLVALGGLSVDSAFVIMLPLYLVLGLLCLWMGILLMIYDVRQMAHRKWEAWVPLQFTLAVFFAAQILGGIVITVYALTALHISQSGLSAWLEDNVGAQFLYLLLVNGIILSAIYGYLRYFHIAPQAIGLKKPRWRDLAYGLIAAPVYFALYLAVVAGVSRLVPGLDIDQHQEIGFQNVHGALALGITFVSLVILPPLAEEIMVRGFLYTSLKKAMKIIPAALLTSLIFAAAHLPEGGAAGPLYIAAIDTFVLSLVLIYLRQKTDRLWASITLHAIKNGIAFVALFVIHLH